MDNLLTEHTQQPFRHGLTSAQLKILAMAIMVIDHIGAFLLPRYSEMYPVCRAIGRLAFPIFCFMIAEGARHTRSMPKYMGRLTAFALISTPPYNLVHGSPWYSIELLNIFFTLLLGLMAIFCIQNLAPRVFRKAGKNRLAESKTACALFGLPFGLLLCFAAYVLNTDYGGYGVAAILIFYLLRERPLAAWGIFLLLTFVCYDLAFLQGHYTYIPMNPYTIITQRVWESNCRLVFVNARQIAAPLAAIPCALYNGQRGGILPSKCKYGKYLFYAFYPAHLLVIWLIQLAIR